LREHGLRLTDERRLLRLDLIGRAVDGNAEAGARLRQRGRRLLDLSGGKSTEVEDGDDVALMDDASRDRPAAP
jgi:hypothetical protein